MPIFIHKENICIVYRYCLSPEPHCSKHNNMNNNIKFTRQNTNIKRLVNSRNGALYFVFVYYLCKKVLVKYKLTVRVH